MADKQKAPTRKRAAKRAAPRKKAASGKKAAPGKKAARTAAARKKVTAGKAAASRTGARKAPVKKTPAKKVGGKARPSEQPLMKALRAEHRHMATIMQLFANQLKSIEEGQLVDTHVVYEIMDYMVTWPDRYHHPREDLIYGRVAEIDGKCRDQVDTLQRDHDQTASRGRKVLREIERWREGEAAGVSVVKLGREYIDHIHEHMNVEEKVVFPQIESVLTNDDWRDLAEDDQLHAVADPVFGPRVQREFRNLARKLRSRTRRVVEHSTLVEWIGIEALMESIEVLSMAYDSVRSSASDHIHAAVDDSRDLLREAPFKAPVKMALNNTKLTLALLEDVLGIGRDTVGDLTRVNQERKDRVRLLDR